jgi:hypothetical protein
MDRISALRRIEEALATYEEGDISLPALEREVRGILRTYASSFQEEAAIYRASGEDTVSGLVVVASSPREARERIADLATGPEPDDISVERVE